MSQNNEKKPPEPQTDDHIRALDPIDHVRLRPQMYVGGNDTKAMTNIAANVFFELVPQIRRNICTRLKVAVLGPKTLQVWNNGQPFPITMNEDKKRSQLEVAVTIIGAGYRHDSLSVGAVGILGLGLPTVNALSSDFTIQIVAERGLWDLQFQKGRKVRDLTRLRGITDDDQWTTRLTFTLDEEIFADYAFDASAIESLLFDYAHLFPGLTVSFENHVIGDRNAFYARTGLAHYLEEENRYKKALHPAARAEINFESITDTRPIRFNGDTSPVSFELNMAFQFLARPVPSRRSFINTHETLSHGTHVEVCLQALRDCLLGHSDIIDRRDLPHLFEHLTLVVSLWHRWPTFQGNATRRLINRDFYQQAYEELSLTLTLFLNEHPDLLAALEALALSARPKRQFRLKARSNHL